MDIKKDFAQRGRTYRMAHLRAMKALYGNPDENIPKIIRKKRKRRIYHEDQEQVKLVSWLRLKNIPVAASANGGRRSPLEGARLKRSGMSAGFPDLFIPIAAKGFHGLLIEMKKISGGVVSEAQAWWLETLSTNGYKARVANGFDEAKAIVEEYLS